jgi:DNA-binding NarL/FixJ family response regulator
VLILSQYVEEGYALELFADGAGGVGYVLKDRVADVERFVEAVRRVGEGGSVLPEVVGHLVGRRRRDDPPVALTAREREVLQLTAEGRSNHVSGVPPGDPTRMFDQPCWVAPCCRRRPIASNRGRDRRPRC